jgi:hypothetical protein
MNVMLEGGAGRRSIPLPWSDTASARSELSGVERLAQQAVSLARAQPVTARRQRVPALHLHLQNNAAVPLQQRRL